MRLIALFSVLVHFSTLTFLYAQDLLVLGATDDTFNGIYVNMDTHASLSDGVDYYEKSGLYIYRHFEAENGTFWLLGETLGADLTSLDITFGVENSNDTPIGLHLLGADPAGANVYKHIIADNMAASGATTSLVNGTYINIGTHATLSDGVPYYQKGGLYLFRITSDSTFWVIANKFEGFTDPDCYYYIKDSSDTPDGLFLSSMIMGTGTGPIINETALSVKLMGFTAIPSNDHNLLSWSTFSEDENLGFIIEKLITDDKSSVKWDIVASYKENGKLLGHGTSTTQSEYEYCDYNISAGDTCHYRLSAVDIYGTRTTLAEQKVFVESLPNRLMTISNYPNPFNPTTRIQYTLNIDANAVLTIINVNGQVVKTLVDQKLLSAGAHETFWDGTDNNGIKVPSGNYFILLKTNNGTVVKLVTLLK